MPMMGIYTMPLPQQYGTGLVERSISVQKLGFNLKI
jgi:hypothetical protein